MLLASVTDIASPKMKVPHWVAKTYARLENLWSSTSLARARRPLESVKLARTRCGSTRRRLFANSSSRNPIERALGARRQMVFENMVMPSAEQAPLLVVAALSYELAKLHRAAHDGLVLLETGRASPTPSDTSRRGLNRGAHAQC